MMSSSCGVERFRMPEQGLVWSVVESSVTDCHVSAQVVQAFRTPQLVGYRTNTARSLNKSLCIINTSASAPSSWHEDVPQLHTQAANLAAQLST